MWEEAVRPTYLLSDSMSMLTKVLQSSMNGTHIELLGDSAWNDLIVLYELDILHRSQQFIALRFSGFETTHRWQLGKGRKGVASEVSTTA